MAAVGQQQQRPAPQAHTQQQTTQLEFTQAMRDFKTMFPEMDEDVIEVVLRSNQGAVDSTIDQLLSMSTDNENERLRTEMDATENAEAPPGYSPVTPPPTYQQAVPYSQLACPTTSSSSEVSSSARDGQIVGSHQQSASGAVTTTMDQSSATSAPVPLRVTKKWCPPLLGPLPCDFLRIVLPKSRLRANSREQEQQQQANLAAILCSEVIQQKIEENERQRKLSTPDDTELAQYLEDERIALFLQNEEFMNELRSNRDFLSMLEREESDGDEAAEIPPQESVGAFPHTKTVPCTTAEESDAVFREKLKNMGKKSKRKFAQLARLFSRQKKRGAKQMYPYARLSEGSMMSKDNLLLEDSDDDDDDPDWDADSSKPQNEYHPIKSSSSPSHKGTSAGT